MDPFIDELNVILLVYNTFTDVRQKDWISTSIWHTIVRRKTIVVLPL